MPDEADARWRLFEHVQETMAHDLTPPMFMCLKYLRRVATLRKHPMVDKWRPPSNLAFFWKSVQGPSLCKNSKF